MTGDRSSTAAEKRAKVGYEHAHAIVDDHSRLAYAELLDDERAATVTAFVTRAFAFFAEHGVEPKRLMTDNAWSYTLNRSLQELLRERAVKHVRTPKRRPQPNGKVERFHQTMAREWAYGLRYRSSRHRAAALPHWLAYYNAAQTAQLARRPTPAQPRSQPVWAGQLDGGHELIRIRTLAVAGDISFRVDEVPLTHRKFGHADAAYGEASIDGRDALVVVTEGPSGGKATVRVRPTKSESPRKRRKRS